MQYIKVTLSISSTHKAVAGDVLAALLAPLGYETFVPTSDGMEAYVPENLFSEEQLDDLFHNLPLPEVEVSFVFEALPDQDWNEAWEAQPFSPITIGHSLAVYDSRQPAPLGFDLTLALAPRQAFGTGTHPTTRTLLASLLALPLEGKAVVDAGCGTGVLAILCRMRGARSVVAYDIDPWSVENARKNIALNRLDGIEVMEGDSSVLASVCEADLLMANIFREIIIADMPRFAQTLRCGGHLLLSGFYESDIPAVVCAGKTQGLRLREQTLCEGWAVLLMEKI